MPKEKRLEGLIEAAPCHKAGAAPTPLLEDPYQAGFCKARGAMAGGMAKWADICFESRKIARGAGGPFGSGLSAERSEAQGSAVGPTMPTVRAPG